MASSVPRLIRLPQVEHMTGLKRSAIYQRIARNEFPAPRRVTGRCSAWLESDVTAWILARPVAGRATASDAGAT